MKTLTEQEKQIETIKAVNAIIEFLRHEVPYNDLVEIAADAQCSIIHMMNDIQQIDHDEDSVGGFIYYAIKIMKLLKPFAKMEGQVE